MYRIGIIHTYTPTPTYFIIYAHIHHIQYIPTNTYTYSYTLILYDRMSRESQGVLPITTRR